MQFAVFKENISGETRVALVPDSVKSLLKKKHGVLIESGAGLAASIPDAEFEAAGAKIMPDASSLAAAADCLLKVRPVSKEDAMTVPEGKALIGFLMAFPVFSIKLRSGSRYSSRGVGTQMMMASMSVRLEKSAVATKPCKAAAWTSVGGIR